MDPYRVWLSEIMLQQTTVAAVTPRFDRFLARWPTIDALAAASDADVLSEWAGLGYYARARNLIACARSVTAMGGFPRSEAQLLKLPGIGAYTSAAIAAIAFGADTHPIDTNVRRVIARLHGLKSATPSELRRLLADFTPIGRAGDVAQALMDLGSSQCRPTSPDCGSCPLSTDCLAHQCGEPEAYPQPTLRKARPTRFGTAFWIERSGSVWLVRRPAKGLLGGMAALPGPQWEDQPSPGIIKPLAHVRHVFTHFALELSIVDAGAVEGEGWWHPVDRLDAAGLPTLYRRAAEAVLARRAETLCAA